MTATAPPRPRRFPGRFSRRWIAWAALIAIALIAWFWQPITGRAVTAASYGAHVACSCRFIAGRDLDDCRKDFEPGMGLISLSEETGARSITATFPLLSSQTATYKPGQGCMLEPWDN